MHIIIHTPKEWVIPQVCSEGLWSSVSILTQKRRRRRSKVEFSVSTNLFFLFISQQSLSLERRMETTKVLVLCTLGQMSFYA